MTTTRECGICMEEAIRDATRLNGCTHEFCYACIDRWRLESNTCPTCRAPFTLMVRPGRRRPIAVDEVDYRLENALDAEDVSEEDDEESGGSELDRYEEDFVLPDGVIEFANGAIVDFRDSSEQGYGSEGDMSFDSASLSSVDSDSRSSELWSDDDEAEDSVSAEEENQLVKWFKAAARIVYNPAANVDDAKKST